MLLHAPSFSLLDPFLLRQIPQADLPYPPKPELLQRPPNPRPTNPLPTQNTPQQERSLDPSVPIPVHTSHAAAVTGGATAGEMFLGAGEKVALWLGAPGDDKLPKDAKEGE